jgi:hypothetical protein
MQRLQGGSIVRVARVERAREMLYVQLLLHTEMQVAQSILTPVAGSSIAVNQHKLLIVQETV